MPATLWRPHHPESFTEVAVFCGQRRIGVEWGRIKPQAEMPLPAIGGMFAAVDVRSQSGRAAIEFGDLLVGVNHKPVPADVSNDEIRLLLTKEQKDEAEKKGEKDEKKAGEAKETKERSVEAKEAESKAASNDDGEAPAVDSI